MRAGAGRPSGPSTRPRTRPVGLDDLRAVIDTSFHDPIGPPAIGAVYGLLIHHERRLGGGTLDRFHPDPARAEAAVDRRDVGDPRAVGRHRRLNLIPSTSYEHGLGFVSEAIAMDIEAATARRDEVQRCAVAPPRRLHVDAAIG